MSNHVAGKYAPMKKKKATEELGWKSKRERTLYSNSHLPAIKQISLDQAHYPKIKSRQKYLQNDWGMSDV